MNSDAYAICAIFFAILLAVVVVGEWPRWKIRRRLHARRRVFDAVSSGNNAAAISLADEIIAQDPRDAAVFAWRGAAQAGLERWNEALNDCMRAVDLGLSSHEILGNLGQICIRLQKFDSAVSHFTRAIELCDRDAEYFHGRGYAHLAVRAIEPAIADLSRAIQLAADGPTCHLYRGHCYLQLGDFDRAIDDLSEALKRAPDSADAYVARARAYYEREMFSNAIADALATLRIEPENAEALNLLAWIQATCSSPELRNGGSAVANAQRACDVARPAEWYHLGTLAAAHAEAGQFDDAVRCARRALDMAPPEERKECQECISRYERHEQRRESPSTPTQTPRR
jgi:tetratricopeptide (TPR) repeat protein